MKIWWDKINSEIIIVVNIYEEKTKLYASPGCDFSPEKPDALSAQQKCIITVV